jgi:hypothetical protein
MFSVSEEAGVYRAKRYPRRMPHALECTLLYFIVLGLRIVHRGVEASDGVLGGRLVSNATIIFHSFQRTAESQRSRHVLLSAEMQNIRSSCGELQLLYLWLYDTSRRKRPTFSSTRFNQNGSFAPAIPKASLRPFSIQSGTRQSILYSFRSQYSTQGTKTSQHPSQLLSLAS